MEYVILPDAAIDDDVELSLLPLLLLLLLLTVGLFVVKIGVGIGKDEAVVDDEGVICIEPVGR